MLGKYRRLHYFCCLWYRTCHYLLRFNFLTYYWRSKLFRNIFWQSLFYLWLTLCTTIIPFILICTSFTFSNLLQTQLLRDIIRKHKILIIDLILHAVSFIRYAFHILKLLLWSSSNMVFIAEFSFTRIIPEITLGKYLFFCFILLLRSLCEFRERNQFNRLIYITMQLTIYRRRSLWHS